MTGEITRRGRTRRALRRLLMGAAAVFVACLGLLSMGTAVGRYGAVPVDSYGSQIAHQDHDLAITVPVNTLRLKQDDVVAIPLEDKIVLYRIEGVDSWTHKVYAENAAGKMVTLKVGGKVSRVTHTVPYAGAPVSFMHGTVPGLILLLIGFALLLKAVTQRHVFLGAWQVAPRRLRTMLAVAVERPSARAARRYTELVALLKSEVFGTPAPTVTQRSIGRGKWWWTRLIAIVAAAIGVFSMTADASFTATATVNQGAISAGRMSITVPAACVAAANACAANSQNRLTLGATGLVPGDMITRAVDVNIDSTTTSGIMTSMTLTTTNNTTPGDGIGGGYNFADGTASAIKVWIQKCSQAWVESGSSPAFTYTCNTGGGATLSDVLGSSLPAAPPAGTCAPSSGTVSTLTATAAGAALQNMTLTANASNHLLISMCLPTVMNDNYQNAGATITWTFTGAQRPATNK